MKTCLWLMFLACLALLAPAGCKQADRAVSAPLARAELPVFEELEPTLPIIVAVEGAANVPRSIIVPEYKEIELTPEERMALGEQEPPELDVLALYRPPRLPEHGVSAEEFRMLVGTSGMGGPLVGRGIVYPRFGRYGLAGHNASPHAFSRPGASVGPPRGPGAYSGRPWSVRVGENRARRPARVAPRVDR